MNVYRPINAVNYDYPIPFEGKMAKAYLWQIEQDARALRKQLGDNDNLPGWVNAYVFTSADRVQAASRYMQYQAVRNPENPILNKRVAVVGAVSLALAAIFMPW